MVPDNFWIELWAAAKQAGMFGTVVMAGLWWLERGERIKERDTGETRHAAVMEVLNTIKSFMEILRDRFPRNP